MEKEVYFMKKLFTLFMALCLCTATPLTTFAAEEENTQVAENLSTQEDIETLSTREMTYNQVWIDGGKHAIGTFTVKNPHTFMFTKTEGTVNIESDNPNAEVQIVVSDGLHPIHSQTLRVGQEARFSSQSNASEYAITYTVNKTSKTAGIRINCWLY